MVSWGGVEATERLLLLAEEREEQAVVEEEEKEAAGLVERRSAVVARWSHRVGERTDAIVVRKSECEKLKVEIQRSRRQTDRRSIFCKSLIGFVPAVPVSLGLFEIDEPFSR